MTDRTETIDPIGAMIHLRADVLRLSDYVEALAGEKSIAHVRNMAPVIAERLRATICKPEYVRASERRKAINK